MNARNGLPGNSGSRAVCGASCKVLDSLRRPRAIDSLKAKGTSFQASFSIIYTASVNETGAFSFGTGTEVETSAGRNQFCRSLTIFGQDTKSITSAGRKYFGVLPTFSAERKSCLCGEKQALLRQTISGTGTEVKTSAGRNNYRRSHTFFGQDTKSITSAGRKYFGVLPTIFGTKDGSCSLRGEKPGFVVPALKAEQKSCLCGEKQALLRQTNIGQAESLLSDTEIQAMERERTMGLKKMSVLTLACAVLLALACGNAGASTLATNFAAVYVDNLKVGGIYNLTETARYPMWVNWTGDVPVDLQYETVIPGAAELIAGYEPVPDAGWVTISKRTVSLLPDETDTVDVTITIPNDDKYLGKKYQAYVLVTSVPPKNAKATGLAFALALKGRVLFTIAAKPPTAAELRELNRQKARESQGVIITPEKFMVLASSSEVRAVITQDVPLKLINPSAENVKISLEAVDPLPNGISIPRDYEKGDYKNFKISKPKFALKKDGIMNVEMTADLKNKEGEKLFYAVKVLIKSGTLEVARFVRIYIN